MVDDGNSDIIDWMKKVQEAFTDTGIETDPAKLYKIKGLVEVTVQNIHAKRRYLMKELENRNIDLKTYNKEMKKELKEYEKIIPDRSNAKKIPLKKRLLRKKVFIPGVGGLFLLLRGVYWLIEKGYITDTIQYIRGVL